MAVKKKIWKFSPNKRKKRKGQHAKTKTSKCKCSDNYKKPYNGQGK